MLNYKYLEWKCQVRTEVIYKSLSQDIQCLSPDSKRGLHQYKYTALPLHKHSGYWRHKPSVGNEFTTGTDRMHEVFFLSTEVKELNNQTAAALRNQILVKGPSNNFPACLKKKTNCFRNTGFVKKP